MDASKESRCRLVDNIRKSAVSRHAQSIRFHKLSASDLWRLDDWRFDGGETLLTRPW